MAFTFDEKEAGSGFAPLPVGEYECVITKVEPKQSSNKNDMLAITLTVREDANEEGGKRKLFDNLVFTDAAAFKVHQYLKALGTEQGKTYADPMKDMAPDLLYRYIRVKTKHEPDRNDPTIIRDRVHYVMPSEAGGPEIGGGDGTDPFGGQTIDISEEDLPF